MTMAMSHAATYSANIHVSDYSGNISSLSLTEKNGHYSLEKMQQTKECGPNPAWLTIDTHRGILFCTNEGLETTNGSLSSFSIRPDGSLSLIQTEASPSGPVSAVIYGDRNPTEKLAIALAHYAGSAVSTWLLEDDGHFSFSEAWDFTLTQPGPDPERQEASHAHEVLLDPTGNFILVPDLGADLVRVFSFHPTTLKLKELESLVAAPGSGPRHAAFWSPADSNKTYFYLVAELASEITVYDTTYRPDGNGLAFEEIEHISTYGPLPLPKGNSPAEIYISDNFLLVSNRNNTSFNLPDPQDGSLHGSDSLATFAIEPKNGKLSFHQLWPSGGMHPRHFSVNAERDLVAVALQLSQEIVVMKRDGKTGLLGEPVVRFPTAWGGPTCVIFGNEKPAEGVV